MSASEDTVKKALGGVGVKGSVQAAFTELVAKSPPEVRTAMAVPASRELAWRFYLDGAVQGIDMAKSVYREKQD